MAQMDGPAIIRAAINRSRLGARAERAQAAAVAARLIRMMRMRPARSEAKPQKGCAKPYAREYAVAAMATFPSGAWNSSAIGIRMGATAKRANICTDGPARS